MRATYLTLVFLFVLIELSFAQDLCSPTIYSEALSPRLANYEIDIHLDHTTHSIEGTELISWTNHSPDSVSHVRLYMYLNAFKNSYSSYLKGANLNVMGQDLRNRSEEEWGWIKVFKAVQIDATEIPLRTSYVQPDDQNEYDQSVLKIDLAQPVPPNGLLTLDLNWAAKLPRIIARSGYAEFDHNHFVHWYPKLGVYEKDEDGQWGWNCHQFLPRMEFYGDHGNYLVNIYHDPSLTIGASGCSNAYKEPISDTTNRVRTAFYAEDVIDFAWVASPNLLVYEDQWEHVDIRLLYPKLHKRLIPRLVGAAKNALQYLNDHVGEYPYSTLTILDPPVHGLRSGFMEYPTYITGGSFYAFPKGIRTLESLIIHEFAHQYFMQIVANNEKEAPWLDEGFVTFYEDCIMEDSYGDASLFEIFGYRVRNSSFTRNEYTSLRNPAIGPITQKSWKVRGDYKGIIYSKTATVLQTLKRYLGADHFDEMMREYFKDLSFSHPRKDDFLKYVYQAFEEHPNLLSPDIARFMNDVLDETYICDYAVSNIINGTSLKPTGLIDVHNGDSEYHAYGETGQSKSLLQVERLGTLIAPVEIVLLWEDGTRTIENWDGEASSYTFTFEKDQKLIAAEIDPERKLLLDIDFNNNSLTLQPAKGGILKYATRSMYWVQNAIQSFSFLM